MRRTVKQKICIFGAVMLAAVMLPLGALALSENAGAVVDRLETMQQANIDPAWTPDIEANQAAVQELLDLYIACSPAERAEFTPQQNTDLRAYFDALYEVQGRDTKELDELFAGRSAASSSAASSSSSSAAASSSDETNGSSSSATSGNDSSASGESSASAAAGSSASGGTSSSQAASSAVSGSVPKASFEPQVPKSEGAFGFLGAKAVSAVLLVVAGLVAILLFVRFLMSIRTASKEIQEQQQQDTVMQELHGSVDAYTLPPPTAEGAGFAATGASAPPLKAEEKRAAKRAAKRQKAAEKAQAKQEKAKKKTAAEQGEETDEEDALWREATSGSFSAQMGRTAAGGQPRQSPQSAFSAIQQEADGAAKQDLTDVAAAAQKQREALENSAYMQGMREAESGSAAATAAKNPASAAQGPQGRSAPESVFATGLSPDLAAEVAEAKEAVEAAKAEAEEKKKEASAGSSLFGQSFTQLPVGAPRGATAAGKPKPANDGSSPRPGGRTGKPNRMSYSQGTPEEIDAIDD